MPPRPEAALIPPKHVSQLIRYLGCICCVKPGKHLHLHCAQMLLSPYPATNFPLPALGCRNLGFLQCSPLCRLCWVPSLSWSQLTGNGALQGAVMIESNDGDLVGLRTRFVPCSMAMKTASHADGSQATQEQQPTDYHHQPGKGEDKEWGQKDSVCRGLLTSLPAWSRANLKARHGYLEPQPAPFGQSPRVEIPHPLQGLFQCLTTSRWSNFFPSV